jgi:hypothetical protein
MIRRRDLLQSRRAGGNSSSYALFPQFCEIYVLIVKKLSTLPNPCKRIPRRGDLAKFFLLQHTDFANYGLGWRLMSAPPSTADIRQGNDNVSSVPIAVIPAWCRRPCDFRVAT